MGQAKLRGSFEKRQAEGSARLEKEERERMEVIRLREESMTPAEKEAQKRARKFLMMASAISIGSLL